jgi:integrase
MAALNPNPSLADTTHLHRLSETKLTEGHNRGPQVSAYSFWYDREWIFEKSTPGDSNADQKFDFKIVILYETDKFEEEFLTDPKYSQLLDELRRFLWSWIEEGTRRASVKRSSIGQYRSQIAFFLRWLASQGYTSFGQVPPRAVMLNFLPFLISEKARADDDEQHTVESLKGYLQIPARLFEQNSVMPEGVSLIRHDPFPGTSPQLEAKKLPTKISQQVPAVPSAIFTKATSAMLTWLDYAIPDILRFQGIYLAEDGPHGARATEASRRNRFRDEQVKQRLLSESFTCLPGESSPWRDRLAPSNDNSVDHHLRSLITDAVSACVLTILALVGMRISEICGLIAGAPDPTTGLPECVKIEPTLNGLFEAFYITGHLYKKRAIPQKHLWAAGLRPVGSSELPPAILAIKHLYHLLEPWRDLTKPELPGKGKDLHNQLLVELSCPRGFPRVGGSVTSVKSSGLSRRMKSWLRRHGHVPADVRITTPAWRKSYALQTYMIDPQLLPAISKHFGHLTEMITYSSYVAGADQELERYRDDVAYREVAQYITSIRRGDVATAGKISEAIFGNREALTVHFADIPEDEIIDAIMSELRKSKIRGFGAPWGICIYRQEWSRCEGSACGPDFVKRTTETCCKCSNLVVLDRHLGFWRNRKKDTEKSLAEFAAFDPKAGIVPVLVSRLAQAEKVLFALEAA